jgi:hypothetical protein
MKEPAEGVYNVREVQSEIEQPTWETPDRLRDQPDPPPEDQADFSECPKHGTFRGTVCPFDPPHSKDKSY